MKTHLSHRSLSLVAIGCFVAAGAFAQTPPAASKAASAAAAVKGPVVKAETVTITGTVAMIDTAKRRFAVKADDQRVATVRVGPNVRNFENLQVGDHVKVRYTEALALALAKGGPGSEGRLGEIRSKVEADAARQAAPGGKPGLAVTERTTLVANVFEIDRERGVLTLRGTDGVPVDIKVSDKKALEPIKLNDQVVIGYRQSAAVSIEPA